MRKGKTVSERAGLSLPVSHKAAEDRKGSKGDALEWKLSPPRNRTRPKWWQILKSRYQRRRMGPQLTTIILRRGRSKRSAQRVARREASEEASRTRQSRRMISKP